MKYALAITIEVMIQVWCISYTKAQMLDSVKAKSAVDTSKTTVKTSLTYRFDSSPFGALVFYRSMPLGTTPLMFRTPELLDSMLTFTLPMHRDTSVSAAQASMTAKNYYTLFVTLTPQTDAVYSPVREVEYAKSNMISSITATKNNSVYKYGASALAVVAGSAAAYFKLQADNNYRTYTQTFDRQYLDESRRLDAYSVIGLVASQLAVGTLVYLFLSE